MQYKKSSYTTVGSSFLVVDFIVLIFPLICNCLSCKVELFKQLPHCKNVLLNPTFEQYTSTTLICQS